MQEKRWALILGVSSGIGKACAKALSLDGFNILGVHFDLAEKEPQVEELEADLRRHSEYVHLFIRNAESKKAREEVADRIAEILSGRQIDLMLHSLAFGTLLPFIKSESSPEVIQKSQMEMTLSVMAHSLVFWTQDLWDRKLLGRGSQIFAMTSGGSVLYAKSYGAVSAAKCALESHVRQLATELAPHGVMVNCLRAGITDTPSLRKIPEAEALLQRARDNNPHGRLSTPEDIGNALRGFGRMKDSWMTGNVINVDGGEILTI
jgi:enoyl-[acyl-carrier protein] reductase III